MVELGLMRHFFARELTTRAKHVLYSGPLAVLAFRFRFLKSLELLSSSCGIPRSFSIKELTCVYGDGGFALTHRASATLSSPKL